MARPKTLQSLRKDAALVFFLLAASDGPDSVSATAVHRTLVQFHELRQRGDSGVPVPTPPSLRVVQDWVKSFRDRVRAVEREFWRPWRTGSDGKDLDSPEETAFLFKLDVAKRIWNAGPGLTALEAKWGKRLRVALAPAGILARQFIVSMYALAEGVAVAEGVPPDTKGLDDWLSFGSVLDPWSYTGLAVGGLVARPPADDTLKHWLALAAKKQTGGMLGLTEAEVARLAVDKAGKVMTSIGDVELQNTDLDPLTKAVAYVLAPAAEQEQRLRRLAYGAVLTAVAKGMPPDMESQSTVIEGVGSDKWAEAISQIEEAFGPIGPILEGGWK